MLSRPLCGSEHTNHTLVDTCSQCYGGHGERETPGNIPNPEAKPLSADGTAPGTGGESRTPPDNHSTKGPHRSGGGPSSLPEFGESRRAGGSGDDSAEADEGQGAGDGGDCQGQSDGQGELRLVAEPVDHLRPGVQRADQRDGAAEEQQADDHQ